MDIFSLLSVRVVNIDKRNFNKDLDNYIENKRKFTGSENKGSGLGVRDLFKSSDHPKKPKTSKGFTEIFSIFKRKIPDDVPEEDKDYKKEVKKMLKEQELERMEHDVEDIQETEDELEEEREGIITKFLKMLRLSGRKRYDDEEELVKAAAVQAADEEREFYRETVKILHRWLEHLPPEKINEFKRSPDFERYKDALRKLGLIK